MNYRNDARLALQRARNELDSQADERLKYAALELRMAMEGVTYDRAAAYKGEFPESEYETWQPKKVMQVLLEIDPNADRNSSLSIGKEPSLGQKPSEMLSMGTETVLNMETLKAHYDALGSYLHVPSLKQSKAGKKLDYGKFRARCETIAEAIEKVLSSPVWNLTLKQSATLKCDCGKQLRRRLPLDGSPTVAICECGASFDVEQVKDGKVHWSLRQTKIRCPRADCATDAWLPTHVLKPGTWWRCSGCEARVQVQIGIGLMSEQENVE